MLEIRTEQLQALAEHARSDFEDRVVRVLDPQGIEHGTRALVRLGIERALGHGITREHDVFSYIALMRRLGADFDRDPRHPWAAEILSGERRHATMSMAEMLIAVGRAQP